MIMGFNKSYIKIKNNPGNNLENGAVFEPVRSLQVTARNFIQIKLALG